MQDKYVKADKPVVKRKASIMSNQVKITNKKRQSVGKIQVLPIDRIQTDIQILA